MLARELKRQHLKIAEMHSDLDQTQRENVILDFKAGIIQIIVATDILARGLDIDDIEMVINFDVPREAEDYVHRVGRTARANRDGMAITFVSPDEAFRLKKIEKLLDYTIPRNPLPDGIGEGPVEKSAEGRKDKGGDGRRQRGASRRRRGAKSKGRKPDDINQGEVKAHAKEAATKQNQNSDSVQSPAPKRRGRHRSRGRSAKSRTSEALSTK